MILVDANLLIYAVLQVSPHHRAARDWLDASLNGSARVGLPWPSLLAFLRLVTNPRIFEKPASVEDAWRHIERWLDCPNVWIPLPTERHRSILSDLLKMSGRGANVIPDADLAALAVEHGLILCTADAGFSRFAGLKWQNPIASHNGQRGQIGARIR
ncbi:MAG TPA: type II toxin-antitoxin system VapC family toxin [Bryobacteraceae bacterium]|jgi:hypothetical protein